MRSQHAFSATSIGTASSVPQIPQTKPQKISPMNTATSLVRAARLVSHGVRIQPSRLVMTSEMPETMSAIDTRAELQKADDSRACRDDHRSEVGNAVEDAGGHSPHAGLFETDHAECNPRRHADDDARDHPNEEEPLDLRVDVVRGSGR